jgi:hypothetical protein
MLNLTPHAIVVETDNGRITFEPSGTVARVDTHIELVGTVDDIPVVERSYGEVENVPELPCDPFLVSSMFSGLPKEYSGVAFAPDTGLGAIRNDKGHIVATSRLITI